MVTKYGGELVYRGDGVEGPLEVVDDALTRSLHFGDATRQSSMLHSHPAVLVLPYTQYMVAALAFRPAPRRVLFLGLGGGSLPRFFAHHYPDVLQDVVELRADVIATAHRFFRMPETTALAIHHMDCARFVADAGPDHGDYDLAFLDIYDEQGVVPLVAETAFLEALGSRLAPHGLLVANLSKVQRQLLRNALRTLHQTYAGEVYRLPVLDKGNEIVIAAREPGLDPGETTARRTAADLKTRFGIDLVGFLEGMERYEVPVLDRIRHRARKPNRKKRQF